MTRRVLVARLDSMGDVLLAGPAVRAVAESAEVVMLCSSRGADAAAMLPGVASTIVWDAPWILDPAPEATPERLAALAEAVRAAEVDEAVILTSFHQSTLPLALELRSIGVARITGASADYAGSLLDVRLRPGEDFSEEIPEPVRALEIAAAAGFRSSDDGELRVIGVADARHLTGPGPYIVLHPGAAAPARRWSIEGYAQAARMLEELGHRVVVTGGADERGFASAIAQAVPGVTDLTGESELTELAGVLAGATVVVCGNTGPAHLAAAVGTPVVSLFSPVVSAAKWAPYGVPMRLLGDQGAPCEGTRARMCPVPGHPCLERVRPEEVVRAVIDLEIEIGAAQPPADTLVNIGRSES